MLLGPGCQAFEFATCRYVALEEGAAAALAQATLLGPGGAQRKDTLPPGSTAGGRTAPYALPRPVAPGALPSHISIFGEGSGGEGGAGGLGLGAALGGEAGGGGGGGGGVRLPSHISAFGDGSDGGEAGGAHGRVAGLAGLVSHALDGVEPSPRGGTPPGASHRLTARLGLQRFWSCLQKPWRIWFECAIEAWNSARMRTRYISAASAIKNDLSRAHCSPRRSRAR